MKNIKTVFSVILAFAMILPIFGSLSVMADNSALANQNPLTQKSVLFVGDSICEAYCEWQTTGGPNNSGWAGRIIANNNMTGINLGKSGASISNCRGSNTVINQLIAQNGQSYNYLIIEGGANDAWDVCEVGSVANGYDADFDVRTYAGGLEKTFQYAKRHFPNSTIGFVFTFQQPSANYGKLSDMSEYFAISKTICDKWGIPYLDLFFDQHFNERVLKTSTNQYLPDYIHPNAAGYDILAPRIEAWMKTLNQTTYNLALNKNITISGTNKGFYYEHQQWGVMPYDADLNDGVASTVLEYNTGEWFGLYNGELTDLCNAPNGVGEIVFDLEKTSSLSYIRAHLRNDVSAGVSVPSSITVSVSDNGTSYTQIGTLPVRNDDGIIYWAGMDANASGRYVKFTANLQSDFCFLNEIEIYGSVTEVEENNIAKFKGYEILSGTGEGFYMEATDYTLQYQAALTDNLYTETNYYTNDWFGFYQGELTDLQNTVDGVGTLVLNLEDVYKISDIKLHLLNDFGANVNVPNSIKAYVSSDNKSFEEIGSFTFDNTDQTAYWTTLNANNVQGQFIKLEISVSGYFCMLNEIKASGDFVKAGIKYNDYESDSLVNIAYNKNYTISGCGHGFYWNNNGTIVSYQAKLTDGINSDLKNFNDEWFGFYQGEVTDTVNTVNGVGTVVIDLEGMYDMTQFRIHMWNSNAEGLPAPSSVKVSVSDDNNSFSEVGYLTLNTNDQTIHWSKLVENATGRYVKIDFALASAFCMINEIHVYGTPAESDDTSDDTSTEVSDDTSDNTSDNTSDDNSNDTSLEVSDNVSSDVIDDSSDVVEDSSDVGEDSSDVIDDSSDVGEDSSDVIDDSSDVVDDSSDVVDDSSDVIDDSSDVIDDSSDVIDDSSDVVDDSSDVIDDSSDVIDDFSDVIDDSSDVVDDSSDVIEDESSGDISGDESDDDSSDVIEEENDIGDINGNDKIDMTDYILLKRAYFGTYNFNETQNKAGDINQNGKIDMTDYILLKRIYFGTYTLKK